MAVSERVVSKSVYRWEISLRYWLRLCFMIEKKGTFIHTPYEHVRALQLTLEFYKQFFDLLAAWGEMERFGNGIFVVNCYLIIRSIALKYTLLYGLVC